MNIDPIQKEAMDLLEEICIEAMKPAVKAMLEKLNPPEAIDIDKAARNLLGNVGGRILFGAESYDQVMAKYLAKKP